MSKIFSGAIKLKSGGHQISVQVEASSPSAAKKAIEAQYSGHIKKWHKQMTSN